jgi:hypothetical protein
MVDMNAVRDRDAARSSGLFNAHAIRGSVVDNDAAFCALPAPLNVVLRDLEKFRFQALETRIHLPHCFEQFV